MPFIVGDVLDATPLDTEPLLIAAAYPLVGRILLYRGHWMVPSSCGEREVLIIDSNQSRHPICLIYQPSVAKV
ncbi:hypothetical protein AWB94_32535 [Mycolicibacterium canariasense]|nr:hypothetical protein AWB94_32535 [Mycolicibacterium canariasense]